jgi:hypothetical protein
MGVLFSFSFLNSCTSPDSDSPDETLSLSSPIKFFSLGSSGSKLVGVQGAQLSYSTDGAVWAEASVPTGPPPGDTYDSWDEGLNVVAWAGDRFFAMGSGLRKMRNSFPYVFEPTPFPVIYTSPDAVTWIRSAFACYCYAVTKTGDAYVLSGTNGGVYTSPDGEVWTTRSVPSTATLKGLAWTGTVLVAVGDNDILTSPDGVTWTKQDSVQSLLASVVWGNPSMSPTSGVLVTVGESGTILTSPDGVAWTTQNSGVTSSLRSVTWTGSRFVTVGANGVVLVSPDGQKWTRIGLDKGVTPEINTVVQFGTRAALSSAAGVWITF